MKKKQDNIIFRNFKRENDKVSDLFMEVDIDKE